MITDFIFATLGENFTIILITKHAGVADNLKQVRKQIQKHQSMALNSVIGVSMFYRWKHLLYKSLSVKLKGGRDWLTINVEFSKTAKESSNKRQFFRWTKRTKTSFSKIFSCFS